MKNVFIFVHFLAEKCRVNIQKFLRNDIFCSFPMICRGVILLQIIPFKQEVDIAMIPNIFDNTLALYGVTILKEKTRDKDI